MLATEIIEADSFRRDGDRLLLSIRMPWYRALPLSSITDVTWSVDGVEVPHDSITWSVNGTTYRLDDLPPRWQEWWYVLDSVVLAGDDVTGGDHRGDGYDVAVTLGMYIPYLPAGPGVMKILEQDRKTVPIGQDRA